MVRRLTALIIVIIAVAVTAIISFISLYLQYRSSSLQYNQTSIHGEFLLTGNFYMKLKYVPAGESIVSTNSTTYLIYMRKDKNNIIILYLSKSLCIPERCWKNGIFVINVTDYNNYSDVEVCYGNYRSLEIRCTIQKFPKINISKIENSRILLERKLYTMFSKYVRILKNGCYTININNINARTLLINSSLLNSLPYIFENVYGISRKYINIVFPMIMNSIETMLNYARNITLTVHGLICPTVNTPAYSAEFNISIKLYRNNTTIRLDIGYVDKIVKIVHVRTSTISEILGNVSKIRPLNLGSISQGVTKIRKIMNTVIGILTVKSLCMYPQVFNIAFSLSCLFMQMR